MNVLLIDDDKAFTSSLARFLSKNGINTTVADNLDCAERKLDQAEFDSVLLDVMLPGRSGFEFLPTIRDYSKVPVIMLTALGSEEDRVTGLELGPDDYITKPFSAKELVARLRATLRRKQMDQHDTQLRLDDLALYPGQCKAQVDEKWVSLTTVERRVLLALLRATNHTASRENLYRKALLRNESPLDRSLDVHISNLRRKLGPHPTKGSRIRALRGLGYALTT